MLSAVGKNEGGQVSKHIFLLIALVSIGSPALAASPVTYEFDIVVTDNFYRQHPTGTFSEAFLLTAVGSVGTGSITFVPQSSDEATQRTTAWARYLSHPYGATLTLNGRTFDAVDSAVGIPADLDGVLVQDLPSDSIMADLFQLAGYGEEAIYTPVWAGPQPFVTRGRFQWFGSTQVLNDVELSPGNLETIARSEPAGRWTVEGGSGYMSGAITNLRLVSSPVPEPATWALMIAGFGAIGGAMRRAQRMVASVA